MDAVTLIAKGIIYVLSILAWAVVGVILWVPLLVRVFASFTIAITASAFTRHSLHVSTQLVEYAVAFWPKQFKVIHESFWGLEPTESEPLTDCDIIHYLLNIGWTVIFWIVTVFMVLLFTCPNTLMQWTPFATGRNAGGCSGPDMGFPPNATATYTEIRGGGFFGGEVKETTLSVRLVSICQDSQLSSHLSVTLGNTGDSSLDSVNLQIWVGLGDSSIRWKYPTIETLRPGENITQTTIGKWLGKPETLHNELGMLTFNIGPNETRPSTTVKTQILPSSRESTNPAARIPVAVP